jgi:hypothetical protein
MPDIIVVFIGNRIYDNKLLNCGVTAAMKR